MHSETDAVGTSLATRSAWLVTPKTAFLFMALGATLARAQDAGVSPEAWAAFEAEVRQAAGPAVRVTRDDATVRLALTVAVAVPSSERAEAVERTFEVWVTAVPHVSESRQKALLAAAEKAEQRAQRAVKRLECEGKEFTDHYVDGLCFRVSTAAQQRQVDAYRRAREVLADVPRFHRDSAYSVKVRVRDGEPTDGTCGEACRELAARVEARFTPYPR